MTSSCLAAALRECAAAAAAAWRSSSPSDISSSLSLSPPAWHHRGVPPAAAGPLLPRLACPTHRTARRHCSPPLFGSLGDKAAARCCTRTSTALSRPGRHAERMGQGLPTWCALGRRGAAQQGLWLDEDAGVQQLAWVLADAHPGALRAHHPPLSAGRRHLNVHDVRQILHGRIYGKVFTVPKPSELLCTSRCKHKVEVERSWLTEEHPQKAQVLCLGGDGVPAGAAGPGTGSHQS